VPDRFDIDLILFDLTSNRGDLISDQIISNFIKCPASALPSAGGSKFDNSALIDANFEKIRGFAPARHLMSFDIHPLMMLLATYVAGLVFSTLNPIHRLLYSMT
jgi:hypothetical protein